jgi:hypothetical protein
MILFVLLLLGVCIHIDYAANESDMIIAANNQTLQTNCTLVNGTHYSNNLINGSAIMVKASEKVHYEPSLIGMYAKPSCGCRHSYTWHYREFINYCPNCGHYGTLRRNPKGVPEKEYTCARCSSDFCGVCGKEKYSFSNVYLKKG